MSTEQKPIITLSPVITDGTKHDATRPPAAPKVNVEIDIQKRLDEERKKAILNAKIEEEKAKKMRIEMQGFKYTPPADMKNIPGLHATAEPEHIPKKGDQINPHEGEEIITL